jgi:hypothetical protein
MGVIEELSRAQASDLVRVVGRREGSAHSFGRSATWMSVVWKIRISRYRGYGLVAMRRTKPVQ